MTVNGKNICAAYIHSRVINPTHFTPKLSMIVHTCNVGCVIIFKDKSFVGCGSSLNTGCLTEQRKVLKVVNI